MYWSQAATDPWFNAIDESYGNGLRVISGFSPITGLIDYRQSGTGGSTTNVQNLGYTWDKALNLTQRQDSRQGLTEAFTYDALNRLDYSTLNGTTNLDVTLDLIGNVTYRSDVGSYTYHATRKHAVTAAGGNTYTYDNNGNVATRNGVAIVWASYNLPLTINGNGQAAQLAYAPDRSRWRQISSYAGGSETTIYVGEALEKMTASASNIVRWRHLIPTPGANVQVTRRSDGTNEVLYVAKDHLGSTDALLNASGTVLARASFAAYGGRRGTAWTGTPTTAEMQAYADQTRRGYTEHEMLDNVGLIHMNGRVYDPGVGRFLSADPVADGIGTAGGFNRYAYVSNRPLSLADPSGFSGNNQCKIGDCKQRSDPPRTGLTLDGSNAGIRCVAGDCGGTWWVDRMTHKYEDGTEKLVSEVWIYEPGRGRGGIEIGGWYSPAHFFRADERDGTAGASAHLADTHSGDARGGSAPVFTVFGWATREQLAANSAAYRVWKAQAITGYAATVGGVPVVRPVHAGAVALKAAAQSPTAQAAALSTVMANTSGYIDLAQDFARWGRQLPGVTKLEDALGPLLDDIAAAADDVARYWK